MGGVTPIHDALVRRRLHALKRALVFGIYASSFVAETEHIAAFVDFIHEIDPELTVTPEKVLEDALASVLMIGQLAEVADTRVSRLLAERAANAAHS